MAVSLKHPEHSGRIGFIRRFSQNLSVCIDNGIRSDDNGRLGIGFTKPRGNLLCLFASTARLLPDPALSPSLFLYLARYHFRYNSYLPEQFFPLGDAEASTTLILSISSSCSPIVGYRFMPCHPLIYTIKAPLNTRARTMKRTHRNLPFCALNHTLFYNLSTPRSVYLHPADYLTVIFTILFTKFQPEAVEEVKYIEKQQRQGTYFPTWEGILATVFCTWTFRIGRR